MVEPGCAVVVIEGGMRVSRDDKPSKHDGDRDGQGVYQPNKTETPKDYERGKHEKDDPKNDD